MRRGNTLEYTSASYEQHLTRAFHCLFQKSKDMTFILSTKGQIMAANSAATRLSQEPLKHVIGKHYKDMISRAKRPLVNKIFSAVIRGKSCRFELQLDTRFGVRVLEITGRPCRVKGATIAVLGTIMDITKQKRIDREMLESGDRYRKLMAILPETIYTLTNEGKISSLNSAFARLTGWPRKKWLGKSFKPLVYPKDLPLAMRTFENAKKGKRQRPYELRIRSRKRGYITGEFTSRPYFENGKIVGEFGIVRDVTARKAVEQALRSSEEKYRVLFEKVPSGLYQSNSKGKMLIANAALIRMLGFKSLKELQRVNIGRDLYLHPTERRAWMTRLEKESRVQNAELWLRRRDGRLFVALENSHVVRDKKGKILYYEGTLTDITKRKILEDRLSALNAYAKKINNAQTFTQVYKITLEAIERTLGFENATFMTVEKGKLVSQRQHGSARYLRRRRETITPDISLELPLDGSKRGVTVRTVKTRKPVLLTNVYKDKDYVEDTPGTMSELTVPIMTEKEVLGVLDVESKELRAFSEKDKILLQILASHSATAMDNLRKRMEIEQRSKQLSLLMKLSADIIGSSDLYKRLRKIAEAIRENGWRRVVIRAVRSQTLDIENKKDLVTVGLSRKERDFLWNNRMPGQVWLERFGPEYQRFKVREFYHLPWNDPWVRKRFAQGTVPSKFAEKDMVDWNPQDLLYAPLRLADGRVMGILSIDDPIDGKRPTQESLAPLVLFIHQAAVAIENAYLIGELNTAKDQIREYANELEIKVKERTKALMEAQNKLVRNERLAAIGEVAAMVGHDLRNPLTGIAGATYYLKSKLAPMTAEKETEMFDLIQKDIEYSDKIITDLLDYSREMELEPEETPINDIVNEALSYVKMPSNVSIVNLVQTQHMIKADVRKLQRVFINIVRNAIDAMPSGGILTIKSTVTDRNVSVEFSDTGVGLSKEVMNTLWKPFFTTKAKGMGLGLPICKRIVDAHKGSILVESTPGKGSTFTIIIPTNPEIEKKSEKTWINLPESSLSTTTKA
jgi:PAS domain S-box-containing protein